jgi:hypothetical protein
MKENTPVGNESTDHEREVSLRAYAELEKELKSFKEDYRQYQQAMSKKLDSLKDELRSNPDSSPKAGGKADTSEENKNNGDSILPIERLRQIREKDKEHPALPTNGKESFERALSIYENFGKWSDKAPKGRVIKSGLKTLLETVTGQDLYWSQIQRACRMLERYSKGKIEYKKTSRHGWILVAKQSVLAGTG